MTQKVRDQVFISYSHKDHLWLERFRTKLAQIESLMVWSDKNIASGANWSQSIEEAIATAKVALLLVSDTFLSSKFIMGTELPKLLDKNRKRGLTIYWVQINHVVEIPSDLAELQAASKLTAPLIALDEKDWDKTIADVCREIAQSLGLFGSLNTNERTQCQNKVSDRLGDRYDVEGEIAAGDFSIVYRARREAQPVDVAVKAIVASPLQTWAIQIFEAHVKELLTLHNESFIPIYDVLLDCEPYCVVMALIEAPTLDQVLERDGPLDVWPVTSIMAKLAHALAELHRDNIVYGSLRSSGIFVLQNDRDVKLRFSPIDLSNELVRSDCMPSNLILPSEFPTYMIPEQYYHWPLSIQSDQYSLALLALEMLSGCPPVSVRAPADLERKKEFFDHPEQALAGLERQVPQQLTRVLLRMLSKEPKDRYPSMDPIRQELTRLQFDMADEDTKRELAKQSYQRSYQGKRDFYERFYQEFFRRSQGAKDLFVNISMERQYQVLDKAIEQLLDFRPGHPPVSISQTARQHREFHLTEEQVEQFFGAFLQAVATFCQADARTFVKTLDAWYITLQPGIDYLKEQSTGKARPEARGTPPARPPGSQQV